MTYSTWTTTTREDFLKILILLVVIALVGGFFGLREMRAFDFTATVVQVGNGAQYLCIRSDGRSFNAGGYQRYADVNALLEFCALEGKRRHDDSAAATW